MVRARFTTDRDNYMTIDLAAFAKEKGVKYFMISFTDLFGGQRAKLVPVRIIFYLIQAAHPYLMQL